MGTGDGRADSHWRFSVVDGAGRKGRHRARHCGRRPLLLLGAGMRFLVRFRNVARMHGVDATPAVVERGRRRCQADGSADRISFTLGDACQTGLPGGSADFVWGEDAWCYVVDKQRLVAEAARLAKPGGVIAFTDWVTGPTPMADGESDRYLKFMKFPNVLSLDEYAGLLAEEGCEVVAAEDTGRFAAHVDLYLNMLNMQLTYDALRIIGFDVPLMESLGREMNFLRNLAHAGKISQGQFVARKKDSARDRSAKNRVLPS